MEKLKPPLTVLEETLKGYEETLQKTPVPPEERKKLEREIADLKLALNGVNKNLT